MVKTDLIIIGSGPGGYRSACYAAASGLSVTVFESAEAGGTCLNCGCIPTKSLCRNAEVIDTLRDASALGLESLSYTLDFGKIMERKNSVVAQLRNGVETLMRTPGITFVNKKAKLTSGHTVVTDEEEYTAGDIIIATGSHAKIPPIKGAQLQGVVTSTELLDIPSVPKRLCIVGAGVIGMEFASAFSSFGSEVTVVEFMKEALPTLDSDIAKRLRQTIGKRGVTFHMQTAVKEIEEKTDSCVARVLNVITDKKGKTLEVEADTVLIATGRSANTDGLGLEEAGIEYDSKGIHTDDNFATNVPHIYAIGDVNGKCMLAHAATFQGIHVVNHILGTPDGIRPDIMPSAIFTNPEAASVGLSEDRCKELGLEYTCKKGFFRSNGKALAMNETDGMVKLISDSDGRIIGCHMFGAHASDMVQEITALMNTGVTTRRLAEIIHIHPTLSEILCDMCLG
ncbi:MAG: dihydrolipoyl dehydrogenase [Prevotella sp. AG:487_50_53]|nr:MAG: dihydrolipoyl dehydrogenase [Prevotella sp. AG:487_50_53]